MLIPLNFVLVLYPASSTALFDLPTTYSSKEANEILRTLDTEIHCVNEKDYLASHCMKKSVLNDLRMVRIDGTELTLQGTEKNCIRDTDFDHPGCMFAAVLSD